jgi:gamma-glutamylaminecyclotransferase
MSVTLFVYGTLKRGDCRHSVLAGQTFQGQARTAPRYRMYNVGSYPALVETPDGLAIEGELWQVDATCLARLDEVEGVAEGLYQRRAIQLAEPFTDVSAQSYFFLKNTAGLADCGPCWQPRSTATWDGGPPPYP